MENATGPAALVRTVFTPTNIHDLPPEVLAKIAEHADESDLPALRLSNKTLSCNAAIAFGATFCTHRKHILSRHSLEGLIAVASHREYGKHVQSVSLGYSQPKYWSLPYAAEDAIVKQQWHFFDSGECLRLLHRALSILHARRSESRWKAISLGIFEDRLKDAYGCQNAYMGRGETFWNNDLMHTMNLLTKAAAATQIEVDNIDVIIPASFSWPTSEALWKDQPGFDKLFKNAFSRSSGALRPSSFYVVLEATHERLDFSQVVYRDGFLRLENFKFGSHQSDIPCFDITYLGSVPGILSPQLKSLRRLDLTYCIFDEGELEELLRKLSSNLAELKLWIVRLASINDRWADIIRWIGHHFTSLDRITIGKITSRLDYGDHEEIFHWGTVGQTFLGENVRGGCLQIASNVEEEEETLKSLYWAWANREANNAFSGIVAHWE